MKERPECLYRGFDGLDVSYTACLPPGALRELHDARAIAEKCGRSTIVRFGPGGFGLDLAETGARGGYRFRGDSGYLGGIWFIKDRPLPEPGNIRVSVHSASLAAYGLHRVEELLQNDLDAMGATVISESVSRIDFAADFRMPTNFRLNPAQFSSHARSTTREHAEAEAHSDEEHIAISWKGRRTSSVTIGKMPGRQLIVYDKRAEALSRGKDHWFEIWKLDRADTSCGIWRVEIRFGKSYLAERARILSYTDLHRDIQMQTNTAMNAVRYLASEPGNLNVTRIDDHYLWQAAREQIPKILDPFETCLDPEALMQRRRIKSLAHRRQLVSALIPGIVALEGYSPEEGRQLAGEIAADCARWLAEGKPKVFQTKAAETLARYSLTRNKSD